MTIDEARWLAGSMKKEQWPEVWIEPGVCFGDWHVSYRRLPSEAPRRAVQLSTSIQARFSKAVASGHLFTPVEELTHEEAAIRTRLAPAHPALVFQEEPLNSREALHETDLPCPLCEEEGRRTLNGSSPVLCRRANGDLVCLSHGDIYSSIHSALREHGR